MTREDGRSELTGGVDGCAGDSAESGDTRAYEAPTSHGTCGANRGMDRKTPMSRMSTAMLAVSAGKSEASDRPQGGVGDRSCGDGATPYERASSTPRREPAS